jgi:hypothetical protein
VSGWQESGNHVAESEKRASYQENIASSSSESFRSYREGMESITDVGAINTTTVGAEAKVRWGPIPSAEVGVSVENVLELHASKTDTVNTDSFASDRNSLALSQRTGSQLELQRTHDVSTSSGQGYETSLTTSISNTSYEETTVGEAQSFMTGREWETATTVETTYAANLFFTVVIRNSGTDRAVGISKLRYNLRIGRGEQADLKTYYDFPDPPSLEPREERIYNVGPVILSLDQMKALDLGEPIKIWVEDFDYGDQDFYESAFGKTVLVEVVNESNRLIHCSGQWDGPVGAASLSAHQLPSRWCRSQPNQHRRQAVYRSVGAGRA